MQYAVNLVFLNKYTATQTRFILFQWYEKKYSALLIFNVDASWAEGPSVQSLSCVRLFVTPWTAARQASCPSPTPGACSNLCPSSRWCHPTISSSVVPFSSWLQPFLASGAFPMSRFFASGGQSIGASASESGLQMNIQDWFSLGWTGWISLQSKGLSRVFFNTTVQKYSVQISFFLSFF